MACKRGNPITLVKFTCLICYILLLGACHTVPRTIPYPHSAGDNTDGNPGENSGDIRIGIYRFDDHSGIIIAAEDIDRQIKTLKQHFPDCEAVYYEFGWGDARCYPAQWQPNPIHVTIALFWPTDSVVYTRALNQKSYQDFRAEHEKKFKDVRLSQAGYANLIKYIKSSYKTLLPEVVTTGKEPNSLFFKGDGQYHLFNTCNKWTAKGLKSAGIPINPTFVCLPASAVDVPKRFVVK